MQDLRKPRLTDGYHYIWKQTKNIWQEHGGKICTAVGTTGLFLSGVHACRKTYKIHDQLQENGKRISAAKEKAAGKSKGRQYFSMVKEGVKCGLETSKSYIADAVGATLSAYLIAKGWHSEHRNYKNAAAFAGVVMADFMNYRGNVISEHGREADRRYMTTKNAKTNAVAKTGEQSEKSGQNAAADANGDEYILQLDENSLRILYSKETTPNVWSESHSLRLCNLEGIRNNLDIDLQYGGSYSVNDVRRYFYGRKGDIGEGGMFGRIWDPGDPEHPERGARVNLHYQEDEDFMSGRTDYCYIIIDIDTEPLYELMKRKKERERYRLL